MKRLLRALTMEISMFCILPFPYCIWDEQLRPLATVFLPMVGILVGGIWASLYRLLSHLAWPAPTAAALMTCFPYLFTGFIHLDGFMDCTDGILSRRSADERQRILKDPHVGSFAVISLCILMLFCYSCFVSMPYRHAFGVLVVIPAATRAVAGLAVSLLPPMGHSQYGKTYRHGIRKVHLVVLSVQLVVTLTASVLFWGLEAVPVLSGAAGCVLAMLYADSKLGGISGDVAGYGITIGEACAVFTLQFF